MSTVYQEFIDQERLSKLKPYIVKPSKLSYANIRNKVNYGIGVSYGPNFLATNKAISVDTPLTYHNFLKRLKEISGVQFKTMYDALQSKPQAGEKICSVRHDLDGDLIAAQQQAEIEHNLGIATSYYLLHTAPYYGTFKKGVFYRNEDALKAYKYMQSLGHEMALHSDSMTIYQDFNIDGSQAITTELEWLRSNGINIVGSTAHNSFGVYGCNNFSIFKNRPLKLWRTDDDDKVAVVHNGKWAPLHVLDEHELGLEYEANDIFWQSDTPVFYASLISQNNWTVAYNLEDAYNTNRKPEHRKRWIRNLTHIDLLNLIDQFSAPAYVHLVVHPMHYGLRISPLSDPWMIQSEDYITVNGVTGISYEDWNGLYKNAISKRNEFDTSDRGLAGIENFEYKILVLGGRNLNTELISVDSKFSQVLARQLVCDKICKSSRSVGIYIGQKSLDDTQTLVNRVLSQHQFNLVVFSIWESDKDVWPKIEYANQLLSKGQQVLCLIEIPANSIGSDSAVQFANQVRTQFNGILIDSADALKLERENCEIDLMKFSKIWSDQAHSVVGKLVAKTLNSA